ncbi:MAG TPA: nitroreductase family protein [Candidatus Limnocylindrales bacterium]|jgi:nitroreductase|nr:nitroreductase family protein [Candidatus Limnocylindrales bacterium]
MDVEQAIGRLRVVRAFANRPVPEADVEAILKAARRTGSSKNTQRWAFIVVTHRERLERLSKVGDYAGHLAGAALSIALLTPDPARDHPYSLMWDLGRAAQNMTLVAWNRGLGSVPATVYDQALCRAILGYPADQHCEYLLSFGYPANAADLERPLRRGGRRPLAEMIHYETWGG